jgi:hypothetical protein
MNPSNVTSQTFPTSTPNVALPPGYDRSMYDRGVAAFERELPELMKTHHRQWVIYHGDRRFGPAKSLKKLEKVCKKERIPVLERVCRIVEPDLAFEDIAFGLGPVEDELVWAPIEGI